VDMRCRWREIASPCLEPHVHVLAIVETECFINLNLDNCLLFLILNVKVIKQWSLHDASMAMAVTEWCSPPSGCCIALHVGEAFPTLSKIKSTSDAMHRNVRIDNVNKTTQTLVAISHRTDMHTKQVVTDVGAPTGEWLV
jgi:hypothetical protein